MARSRSTDTAALVEAAAAVFESKGYQHATIDDIADAAGVSRPTVYKYTSSKRALLDSMVDAVCDELGAKVATVVRGDAPAVQRVRRLIGLHVETAVERRRFYAILFSEQVELSPKAADAFHRFSHMMASNLQGLLDECVASRSAGADRVDTGIASNLVLSMLTTLYRWYDPDGPVGPEELVEQIAGVISGLLPVAEEADLGAPTGRDPVAAVG